MQAAKLANLGDGQRADHAAQICAPVTQDRAAEMLNVSRRTVQAAAKVERESPEVFEQIGTGGLSLNLHRRHLNESQRGMVAAKLANMAEGRPKKNSANLQSYEPVSQSRAAAAPPKSASKPAT